jgi:hypothetical protein
MTLTPSGLIQVHGGGAGQAEGGEIRLRTAAGYDSTYNHYFIDAYQDDLRIGREGGADITLSSSGSVGIGTTTPSTALQVVGAIRGGSLAIGTDDTTAGTISAYGDGAGSSEGGQLNLYIAADYDSTYNRWQIDAYEDDLRIFTDVAEVIRVTPTGNVGIGITTPSTALQVVGGIRVGADGNEDLLLKRGTPAVTVGGSTAAGIITTTGTGAGSGHVGIEVPANDADDGFYIATDSDLDGTVDNLAVKIIANGNVGIGTASPAEKLHVSGNIMLDNNTALLSKRVLGDTLNLIGINNTGQGSIEIGEASTVPDGMFIYTPTDAGQGVTFHNGTDPLMFIENDGNVGIGTTSPAESLDVVGAGRFSTGVTFGTDTDAANKLDDYEEGTWIPTISFGGASVGVGYDYQVGTYTKIGDLVTASCYLDLSAKGSSTGAAVLAGMPFASRNLAGNLAAATLRLSNISFSDVPMGYNSSSTFTITLQETTNAGTVTALTDANFSDISEIMMSISYRV